MSGPHTRLAGEGVYRYTPFSPIRAALPTGGRYVYSRSAESLLQERAMGFEPTTSSLGS